MPPFMPFPPPEPPASAFGFNPEPILASSDKSQPIGTPIGGLQILTGESGAHSVSPEPKNYHDASSKDDEMEATGASE